MELETEEERLREMRYQNYKARDMSSTSRLSRHQLTFVRDYEYEMSRIARERMKLSAETIRPQVSIEINWEKNIVEMR